MKIVALCISQQNLPLKKVFRTAIRTATEIHQVSVSLICCNGKKGHSSVGATTKVTGETIASIKSVIKDFIFPQICGSNIENIDTILTNIQKSVPFNYSAKAAVDMAVYDLYSQFLNKPLYDYLGMHRNHLKSSMTIGIDSLESMCQEAKNAVDEGFTSLKIKVGRDYKQDILTIESIYNTVGKDIALRLDANQGWNRKDALFAIKQFEKYSSIEFIEQPLIAHDIIGMKWIKDQVAIPIMADESMFDCHQAMEIIKLQAADFINIKLLKCGGIYPAIKIAKIAEEAGIDCMLGCMMEGPLSIASSIYFACSQKNITRIDLDSLYFLHSFELPDFINYANGNISIKV